MNRVTLLCRGVLCALVSLVVAETAWAQKEAVPARVTETVDDSQTTRLRRNVHPLARAENDQGALADSQPLTRMLLLLQRSREQEQALQQLLDAQQTKGSGNYHAWLTPEQFGKQFGTSDADVQALTDWLTRQGFSLGKVAVGRTAIEFSGNVAQVRNAFHTEMHRYMVNGKEHFANASDPAIPSALAPAVAGIMGLHNFRKKSFVRKVGKFRRDLTTGQISPLFTYSDVNGTFYAVGPGDFAKIYNVPTAYNGTGESIAVVGRSNINIQDVRDFRSMFGLPAKDPVIVLNGPDPGIVSGDEGESDLDVEWAGAVAPAANIIFVTTQGTFTDGVDGVDSSALYIVDNNVAPVLSDSYGACEAGLGAGGNAFYNAIWQQAAAEGITVVVAAGDNGSAGCDDQNSQSTASGGIAVSGLASTPYNVAAGGTDFDYSAGVTTYWNTTTGTVNSALGYIPEKPWNDSCAAGGLVTSCAGASSSTLNIVAASGGPSAVYTGALKPKWQTGLGDANRDLPDISLFSGDGVNFGSNTGTFYVICQSDQDIAGDTGCSLTKFVGTSPFHDFQGVGGTSAATPTFAGIMALVNQKTGQRQGNANYVLYKLANTAGVFHDITSGNISVPCAGNSPNCSSTSTAVGVMTTIRGGTTLAFAAGTGYDMASGLGSLNVTNLINSWASAAVTGTSTTLTGPSPASLTVDASVSVSGSVTKLSGTGTPTGIVLLENAATGAEIATFALDSSGNYSGSTTLLPGGTYSVKAHYGGDGTFGASDSSPTGVIVGKQNSQVIVSWVGTSGTLSTATQSVAYGSPYILRIDVANNSGKTCQNLTTLVIGFVCPSGTISLFKGTGSPLNDFPNAQTPAATNVAHLNDRGFAEDQPIQLSAGTTYSITATYSGDNSYNAQSNSNTLSVTITKAITTTSVSSNVGSITKGATVTLTATVSSGSNGEAPCGITNGGTVQFTNNGTVLTGTVSYTAIDGSTSTSGAGCIATLTTAISALYPPPATGPETPTIPRVPLLIAFLSLLLFALGLRWILQTRRRAYAYCGLLAIALLVGVIAGCGGGGGSNGTTTRTIGATYAGDTNYSQSAGTTTITVQ
jgi:subtilase family serine protease